jgi:sulfhydrogenase subunit beta (sulfur reductase)
MDPPRTPRILGRSELDQLIAELRRRGYEVIGPLIRDEAIVYGKIRGTSDLPVGWRDVQAPGRYRLERRDDDALFGYVVGPQGFRPFFHVPEERLFSLRRKGASFEATVADAPAPRLALFGARGCDLAALATQDLVFMQASVPDPRYAARRSDVIVVAVSCNEPAATCFCVSMGTGPTPHDRGPLQPSGPRFDLALTELVDGEHRFLVEVGSEVGSELLDTIDGEPAAEADLDRASLQAEAARAAMVRHVDNDGIKELLYAAAEHPRFDDVASRCLTCTNCTMVCPTCFCGRVDDATSLDGETAERTRSWDSCFSLDHSHMHGGPARSSVKSRYRQWLTHKLASWHDQFGVSGCVGCGRCITWCPAGIDITEEVAAIRATKDEP